MMEQKLPNKKDFVFNPPCLLRRILLKYLLVRAIKISFCIFCTIKLGCCVKKGFLNQLLK